MYIAAVIGAIPRMGKTFLLRLLLLIAALDVRAELHTYDLKGTGDLDPVGEAVSHRHRAGEDDEDIEYALADMRELQEELRRMGEDDPLPAAGHLPRIEGHLSVGGQALVGAAPDRGRGG